jgi:four helix bundle protein
MVMKIERFEDLEVWQEARRLSCQIYELTSQGEFQQDLRFKYQIRSSAGSIMDNIAEGFGRGGNKEFINFLSIAKGSNDELRSQCHRAFDFQYINQKQHEELIITTETLSKRIGAFMNYLKQSNIKGPKFK